MKLKKLLGHFHKEMECTVFRKTITTTGTVGDILDMIYDSDEEFTKEELEFELYLFDTEVQDWKVTEEGLEIHL